MVQTHVLRSDRLAAFREIRQMTHSRARFARSCTLPASGAALAEKRCMLVSSLLLTTDPNAHNLLPLLGGDDRIVVGEMNGRFLPVVATTASLHEARELTRVLQCTPGISDLQLVAWFDDSALEEHALEEHAPETSAFEEAPSDDEPFSDARRQNLLHDDEDQQELP